MRMSVDKKKEFYKQTKIAGVLLFLPFVLVAGPLAGNFLGEYLRNKFNLGQAVSVICITMGFVSSAVETIRLIRLAIKIDKS
ncbi:MAG: DUF456 domain-containing protein [Candidatus Omnitrophota bacterium]|nr:DUF456 domain-containing protein [Candidatus Omnitrophota bacterium]